MRNQVGVRELEPGTSLASVEVSLTIQKKGGHINRQTHKCVYTIHCIEPGSLTKKCHNSAPEQKMKKIRALSFQKLIIFE